MCRYNLALLYRYTETNIARHDGRMNGQWNRDQRDTLSPTSTIIAIFNRLD